MDRDPSSTSSRDSKSRQSKDSIAHGQRASKNKDDGPPPIAPVKGQEPEAILVAPDDKSVKPDKDGGKSVAGRKKFSGGEKWDVATGKEAPVKDKVRDSEDEKGEKGAETEEEHEIEAELNGILKKGPSKLFFLD